MSYSEIAKLLVSIEAQVQQCLQGIDQVTAKTQKAETSFSSLGRAAEVAGGIIIAQLAQKTSAAVTSAFKDSAQAATDFEMGLAKIQMASMGTVDDMDAFIASVLEAAKVAGVDFGTGAIAATDAILALTKAGVQGEDAITALNGVLALATIEQMGTAEAANLVVQSLVMFGKEADEATAVVDNFVAASTIGIDTAAGYAAGMSNVGAQAAIMGMSLEETTAALVILDNTFGSAVESGTFLNMMLRELAVKAEEADVSIYNADGSMKSLDEIVRQLKANITAFGDDQEAVNEYINIFSVRAQRALTALVNYDGSISEVKAHLGEQATAQDQVNIFLDTFAGKQAVANSEMQNANIESGKLTASLTTMWKEFAASLGPIGSFTDALGPSMLQGVMSGLTMVAIPALIGKLTGAAGLTAAVTSTSAAAGIGSTSLAGVLGTGGPVLLAIGATIIGLDQLMRKLTDGQHGIEGFGIAWANIFKKASEDIGNWWAKVTGATDGAQQDLNETADTTQNLGDVTDTETGQMINYWTDVRTELDNVAVDAHQMKEGWSSDLDTMKTDAFEMRQRAAEHLGGVRGQIDDTIEKSRELRGAWSGDMDSVARDAYEARNAANALKSSIDALRSKTITITTIRREELRTIRGDGGSASASAKAKARTTPTAPSRQGAPSSRTTTPSMPRSARGRQHGGIDIVWGPTLFEAGEAGPELVMVTPLKGRYAPQMMPGSITVSPTINFPSVSGDIENPATVRRLVDAIAEVTVDLLYSRGRRR